MRNQSFSNILVLVWLLVECSGGQNMETLLEPSSMETDQPKGYFESKIGRIAYWIEGKGNTILLLHSAGHDHKDFDSIREELSKNYRVVSIDWPGHGHSPNPNIMENASAVKYAEVLPDFVKQLAPEGVVVIGNSIGGFAGMKLALEKPSLVKGLILVDTGGMNEPDWKTRLFVGLKGKPWFTGLVWNLFPNHYIKIENKYTRAILERIRSRKVIEGSVEVNASIWRSFLEEGHDLRESAKNIKVPTLIVWGEFDPVILPEIGKDLREKIQGSNLVLLKTGHVPFAEDPKSFLKFALPFIRSVL